MPAPLAWLAAALLFLLVPAHVVALQRIALALLLAGFIYHGLRTAWFRPPLWRPIAAWIGLGAASIAWSVAPDITADELLDEALYPLLLFLLFYRVGASSKHDVPVMGSVLAGIALLSLLSLGGFETLITDEGRSGWLRYYPGVGQASTHAAYAIAPLFVAWRSEARAMALMGSAGLFGCLAVGAAAVNRMFWPAAAAALLVSSFGLHFARRARYVVLGGLAACVFALATVVGVQYYRFAPAIEAQGGVSRADIPALLETEVRPRMWSTWLGLAMERPWLGLGFGQEIPRHYHRPRAPQDPILANPYTGHHGHNLFLNTMLQTGIVGVAVLLWLLAALTWRFLRQRNRQPVAAWAGVALVSAMILKNTTDDFMRDAVAMYFWALAGWLLAVAERPRTDASSP